MAVLPFVIQPKKNTEIIKIGDEQIGVFEIERKGYLTVAEKSFVENVTQGSDGVSSLVLLANKVAAAHKTTPEKAYMAITEAMSGNNKSKLAQAISSDYSEELSFATTRMAESMQRRQIAAATILLQTRINHEWSIQDTLELDPMLVQQLTDLYDREEQRESIEPVSKEEEAKHIVGKSPEESGA
jgi:hypothetical protein